MRATLFFLVAALLFAASAVADESLETIRNAVRRTEESVGAIKCSYILQSESTPLLFGPASEEVKIKMRRRRDLVEWTLDAAGSGRVEVNGHVVDEMSDGTVEEQDEEIIATLVDGTQKTVRSSGDEEKQVIIGKAKELKIQQTSPLQMTTTFRSQLVSKSLTDDCRFIEEAELDGRKMQVVDIAEEGQMNAVSILVWVDVERGSVVKKMVKDVEENEDSIVSAERASEFVEVRPGVWFPNRYRRVLYRVGKTEPQWLLKENIRVTEWAVNDK